MNGFLITEETLLHNGDRIELGVNHFFRINCPIEKPISASLIKPVQSLSDFKHAQEEVLLSKIICNVDEEERNYDSKSPDSSDSIDENSVGLEFAIRKFGKNYPAHSKRVFSTSSSSSSLGNLNECLNFCFLNNNLMFFSLNVM